MKQRERELRTYPLNHLRRVATGEATVSNKLEGYAAVFNSLSEDLGGFREQIAPGAFKKTISENDIRAFWNHDSNIVLGRTKNNTLMLSEDDRGVVSVIDVPDNQLIRDMVIGPIERGDVDQMSFGFDVIRDNWENVDDEIVRTLLEVRLWEVSPVAIPAYTQTQISARALQMAHDLRDQHTRERGLSPSNHDTPAPTITEPRDHSADWRLQKLAIAKRKLQLLQV